MVFPGYLAMTDYELQHCAALPCSVAWMACYFSAYGWGLSNIPNTLPKNSLILLTDQVPPQGHDPDMVAQQLSHAAKTLDARGIILDFQREYTPECLQIAQAIRKKLPCPVAITPTYAKDWDGPVFLPPIPPEHSVKKHLTPWENREIWLEADNQGSILTVDHAGCTKEVLTEPLEEPIFYDESLCCHYHITLHSDRAEFYLMRTDEDLCNLLRNAEASGVSLCVGLYQQFR